MDAALDQLDREHKSLTNEAAMPELPDPSLAWEELSAVDRRALTEMLVDKIIIERHPSKIDDNGWSADSGGQRARPGQQILGTGTPKTL
jgi:hypothetical protein